MKYNRLTGIMAALAVLLTALSCSKHSSVLEEGERKENKNAVSVSLAFNMKDVAYSPATKTVGSIAQADSSFRGISNIYFLPFLVQRTIEMTDQRSGDYLELPYAGITNIWGNDASSGNFTGLVNSNNSHLYGSIYIPKGTGSFLVYGKANDVTTYNSQTYTAGTQAFKHLNGSLIASDEGTYASDITFSPEPIVTEDAQTAIFAKAQRVAYILNDIVNSEYTINYYSHSGSNNYTAQTTTQTWTASTLSSKMNDLYNQLTGAGSFSGIGGAMFSGSGSSITHILKNLYTVLSQSDDFNGSYIDDIGDYIPYANNSGTRLTYNEYYNRFRTAIMSKIARYFNAVPSSSSAELSDSDLREFPVDEGLPEGCIAVHWNGSRFEVVQEGNYTLHLAPMSRFCYNPNLWYFTNSRLHITQDEQHPNWFTNANATWDVILGKYTNGTSVGNGAVSVAIDNPLQYATALLELSLAKTSSSTLLDADSLAVKVNNTNFPMTAVLVAGQHVQNFDFTPVSGNEYYVYDNMMTGTSGQTLAWISSTANNSPAYSMLLQTMQGTDVRIAVEFQNNSSVTFRGATGYILPGSKFYLMGELSWDDASGDKTVVKSVLQQDYKTSATLNINSLKNAYNCIPDMQEPQLEIGVEINVDWLLATPTNVPLY